MAEYIEREQALDVINLADFIADEHGLLLYADSVQARLLDIPSADVVPVVHGHWITEHGGNGWDDWWNCTCSICGERFEKTDPTNYCSNCGARMVHDG